MIRRRKWHQIVFGLAGAYNIFWGLYTVFDPQWFFRFAGLEPINHPPIFSCLGMVIGLYGLLYWKVAQRPETGFEIAVVGFFGKVAGPIGMAYLVSKGDWPAKAALLCVTNDLIWLIPFAIYFADYLRFYRSTNG
jgi:hypothetical protein